MSATESDFEDAVDGVNTKHISLDETLINISTSPLSIRKRESVEFAESSDAGTIKQSDSLPSVPTRRSISQWLRETTITIALEDDGEDFVQTSNPNDNPLFISRLHSINREFKKKTPKDQEQVRTGTQALRNTFNEIKTTIGNLSGVVGYSIDWDFWTKVVNDYESVVMDNNLQLHQAINAGIPREVRGMIWQLISNSKNFQLEELFTLIKDENSIHEKAIKRDLARTSFVTSNDMVDKLDALYNIIKCYSLFDPEVGYTQGMAFIAVPLLMNMTEGESFCLLVTLMKQYNLRSLFLSEMRGLHLLLYQFDRLLEEHSPRLYNHLMKQGIKSSMYASQWFLTFFAYKFPLEIVLRIYDIIVTQGMESILKFAINLMLKNEEILLTLNFDRLLEFLKDNLFNYYLIEETQSPANVNGRRFSSFISKKSISNNSFKLDLLVTDSMSVQLSPVNIRKYELEFDSIYKNEKVKEIDIESMKLQNGKLRHEIKALEGKFANLNKDHIDVVNEMVSTKITIANLFDENVELEAEIEELTSKLKDLESKIIKGTDDLDEIKFNDNTINYARLPQNIEEEIKITMEKNLEVMEQNRLLEEELMNLEDDNNDVLGRLKPFEKETKKWFKWS